MSAGVNVRSRVGRTASLDTVVAGAAELRPRFTDAATAVIQRSRATAVRDLTFDPRTFSPPSRGHLPHGNRIADICPYGLES